MDKQKWRYPDWKCITEVYVDNNLCDKLKLCRKFFDLTSVISKLLFVANVKTLLLGKKSATKDKMSTQVQSSLYAWQISGHTYIIILLTNEYADKYIMQAVISISLWTSAS